MYMYICMRIYFFQNFLFLSSLSGCYCDADVVQKTYSEVVSTSPSTSHPLSGELASLPHIADQIASESQELACEPVQLGHAMVPLSEDVKQSALQDEGHPTMHNSSTE